MTEEFIHLYRAIHNMLVTYVGYKRLTVGGGALSNAAVRPSVCLSVCPIPSSTTVHFRVVVTMEH